MMANIILTGNRTSGQCIYGYYDQKKDCDFTTTGLTTKAKQYIGDAVWNTGAISSDLYHTTGIDLKAIYNAERSDIVGDKGCIDYIWLTITGAETITPFDQGVGANFATYVPYYDGWSAVFACYMSKIYPTVYLKSSVGITKGNGTESNPYVLAI